MPQQLDRALLEFVGFVRAHQGIPPTVREFTDLLGLVSPQSGHHWLRELERNFYIEHAVGRGETRDYVLTVEGSHESALLLMELAQ